MALIDWIGGNASGDNFAKNLFVRIKDKVGNGIGRTQREQLTNDAEGLLIAGKNDGFATIMRTDRKGNQLMGNYTSELIENFEGAALNVSKFVATSGGFVPAQSTLVGYNYNPTNITTANSAINLISNKLFAKIPRVPLQAKRRFRHNLVLNSGADFGFGIPSGNTVIVPNGVSFRIGASNTLQGVITLNGAEIAIGNIIAQTNLFGNVFGSNLTMADANLTAGYFTYDIIIDDDNAVFTIQDTENGVMLGMLSLTVPRSAYKMFAATALPYFERLYNLGVAPTQAPVCITSELQVLSLDWSRALTGSEIAGNLGANIYAHPNTGLQSETWVNSSQPISAVLSNTAASYTSLGGKFQFAPVATANETDYCLFGFQVPANNRYIIEGVRIETYVTGAAIATTPTVIEWALGFGGTVVSLVSTPNRKSLGTQNFLIGDAIGKAGQVIDIDFKTPISVESARFIQLIMRTPIGTQTASQIFRGLVSFKGRTV